MELVDAAELVGPAEIAERLGVAANTVSMWRARGLLPAPVAVVSRVPVWTWSTVRTWAEETGRARRGPSAEDIAAAAKALPAVRAQVRRAVEEQAGGRAEIASGMARPPRKLRGDGKGNGRGEWDWFYALGKAEREHLARAYMRADGLAPDEYAAAMAARLGTDDVETACAEWLAACRLVDALRSLRGGRPPAMALEVDGYDVGRLYGPGAAEYLAELRAEEGPAEPAEYVAWSDDEEVF